MRGGLAFATRRCARSPKSSTPRGTRCSSSSSPTASTSGDFVTDDPRGRRRPASRPCSTASALRVTLQRPGISRKQMHEHARVVAELELGLAPGSLADAAISPPPTSSRPAEGTTHVGRHRHLVRPGPAAERAHPRRASRAGSAGRHAGPSWTVRATALNHHDLWSLKGVGLREEQLPMILGTDASGVDEEGSRGHRPRRDRRPGSWRRRRDARPETFAAVGGLRRHPCRARGGAAAEPGAKARRALVRAGVLPADRVADRLPHADDARPAGPRRDHSHPRCRWRRLDRAGPARQGHGPTGVDHQPGRRKRDQALSLGADDAFDAGARLPERVDAVMESVGAATWAHSLKSLRPGGRVVVCGATSGPNPPGRPGAALLSAAVGDRVDHGDSRRARRACCSSASTTHWFR